MSAIAPADGLPYWQATVKAASNGFVSKLFPVNDTLISRFDNGTMCSQFLLKTLHEGRRHRSIRIDFQKERQMAVLEETDANHGRLVRQAENSIPKCAYDLVSALFYVRSLPLEVGRTFQVPVNDGSKTLPIQVEVQAEEESEDRRGGLSRHPGRTHNCGWILVPRKRPLAHLVQRRSPTPPSSDTGPLVGGHHHRCPGRNRTLEDHPAAGGVGLCSAHPMAEFVQDVTGRMYTCSHQKPKTEILA